MMTFLSMLYLLFILFFHKGWKTLVPGAILLERILYCIWIMLFYFWNI